MPTREETIEMQSLIQQWCESRGLPPDGEPALGYRAVVIDNVRVRLNELRSGAILVESQIGALPVSERERDPLILKFMKLAVPRMRHSRARLVSDSEATALWLQISLAGTSSEDQLSLAIEDLVNEVERWRKVM